MKVGDRCEQISTKNRGEIGFIGKIPGKAPGYFVGIKLDEPCGKNGGVFKGILYFDCGPGYGTFLRSDKINVGEFPEIDFMDMMDSSDDEI